MNKLVIITNSGHFTTTSISYVCLNVIGDHCELLIVTCWQHMVGDTFRHWHFMENLPPLYNHTYIIATTSTFDQFWRKYYSAWYCFWRMNCNQYIILVAHTNNIHIVTVITCLFIQNNCLFLIKETTYSTTDWMLSDFRAVLHCI